MTLSNKDKVLSYLMLALFFGSTAFPALEKQFPDAHWLVVVSAGIGCLYRAFSYGTSNNIEDSNKG